MKNGEQGGGKESGKFTFQRMGGTDQVVMLNDYDWQNLGKLDAKLWMALSCPIAGLEFSQETLALLDTDKDGRIRAQEVRDAVAWVCLRIAKPSSLNKSSQELAISELREDTPEGQAAISALKIALGQAGKSQDEPLSLASIKETLDKASDHAFNGDGVITLESATEAASTNKEYSGLPDFIKTALAIIGAKRDASGKPGLDQALASELFAHIAALMAWRKKIKSMDLPLGERTGEAWALLQRLKPKLDDFFNRCQLAAYAPDTIAALGETALVQQLAGNEEHPGLVKLDREALLELPLARINSKCELDLTNDPNPAWKADLALFASLFEKDTGPKGVLGLAQWQKIWERFGEYASTLTEKPDYPLPPAGATQLALPGLPELYEAPAGDPYGRAWMPAAPNQALDALNEDRLASLLAQKDAFAAIVKQDLAAPPLASFQELYKLALFNAHLYTFLMNFLSFMDFYNPEKKAIFQSGTLYLNSLGCMLSVPVESIEAHAILAAPSHLCLIYCECSRAEADGAKKTMTIASALTQGSLADLLDGRHGLFIDNAGKEWDTRIARIIHNPISIREAVWSPYRRLANMASQQIQKFISKKEEEATGKMTEHATAIAQGKTPETKQGFDFAKGAGIFAALGLALSAVSAAFAYIANSLASLGWFWPLALVLVFICISGPSAILAWLKLRKRSLAGLTRLNREQTLKERQ